MTIKSNCPYLQDDMNPHDSIRGLHFNLFVTFNISPQGSCLENDSLVQNPHFV